MRTLIKYSGNDYLAEIFQSLDIKFSFVKKIDDNTFEQQTTPAKCRDFLGDCIWSKVTGKPVSIYGFKYDYKAKPYDSDALRLSLTFPSEESYNNFITNSDADDRFNIIVEKTDQPLTLIVEADKLWQEAIWKLSLFTFYLKIFSYENFSELKEPEDKYMSILTPEIEAKLLSEVSKEGREVVKESLSASHNRSGFVSIITRSDPVMYEILLGSK
jgi:hypothetical protein